MVGEFLPSGAKCHKCRQTKPAAEMHNSDICETCWKEIQDRNKGKPKPKGASVNSPAVPETRRRPPRIGDKKTIANDGPRVPETIDLSGLAYNGKATPLDGLTVSETDKSPIANDQSETGSANGPRVSETENMPSADGQTEPEGANGLTVSETRLKEILLRLSCLEITKDQILEENEILARRIDALERKAIRAPSKKSDEIALKSLRDELKTLLEEKHRTTKVNGIYVKSLYGPNGRKGGKLNISKAQAFRLRDTCRLDPTFKVEQSENKKGNWLIRLNLHIN